MMFYYVQALKKYAVFSGRATRQQYWLFMLIHVLIAYSLVMIDSLLGLTVGPEEVGVLTTLYLLLLMIPSLAITVRRFHDRGKSSWHLLILFIPLIGYIYYLFMMCSDSEPYSNKYGDSTKYQPSAELAEQDNTQSLADHLAEADVINRSKLNNDRIQSSLDNIHLRPLLAANKLFSVKLAQYNYTIELSLSPIILGRVDDLAPQEVQKIFAEDAYLSRQHCQLYYRATKQQIYIKCLSNNGMTINLQTLLTGEESVVDVKTPLNIIMGNTAITITAEV